MDYLKCEKFAVVESSTAEEAEDESESPLALRQSTLNLRKRRRSVATQDCKQKMQLIVNKVSPPKRVCGGKGCGTQLASCDVASLWR